VAFYLFIKLEYFLCLGGAIGSRFFFLIFFSKICEFFPRKSLNWRPFFLFFSKFGKKKKKADGESRVDVQTRGIHKKAFYLELLSSSSVREEVPQRNLSSSRKVMSDRCSNL
jgi:hypothetical protein